MARMNLSIPDDLKARMDALGERGVRKLNWSSIAQAEFERTILTIEHEDTLAIAYKQWEWRA